MYTTFKLKTATVAERHRLAGPSLHNDAKVPEILTQQCLTDNVVLTLIGCTRMVQVFPLEIGLAPLLLVSRSAPESRGGEGRPIIHQTS